MIMLRNKMKNMFLLVVNKRSLFGLAVFFLPLLSYAQSQYDYYDDDAVAGGADRALNGLLIIIAIVLAIIVIAFIGNGMFKVYYWFNPDADPELKNRKAEEEKTVEKKKKHEEFVQKQHQEEKLLKSENNNQTKLALPEIDKLIIASSEELDHKNLNINNQHEFEIYSSDYRRFLRYEGEFKRTCSLAIFEGTEVICSNAIYSSSITRLSLPQSILYIGEHAICCHTLKELKLPDSLLYLGEYALWECEQLSEITIPQHVNYIGVFALPNTHLKQIINKSSSFIVIDNCLYTADMKRLIRCFGDKEEICIPEGVEDIAGAFVECKKLKKVSFPESLSVIGEMTFKGCDILNEIHFSSNIEEIGYSAFSNCKSLESIILPEGIKKIGDGCFCGCSNLCYVQMPSTLEIEVPDNPKYRIQLFNGCASLKYIFIPRGFKHKYSSFIKKELLTESSPNEYFNNHVNEQYNKRTQLLYTEVSQNDKLDGWTDLYDVRYSKDKTRVLYSSLKHSRGSCHTEYINYEIEEGVKVICDDAFKDCIFDKFVLPNTLEIIGKSSFAECKNLHNIEIPFTVYSIGEGAFSSSSLITINLPRKLKKISKYTFYWCSLLSEINIPKNVEVIEDYAFYNCDSLKELIIPENVKSIGNNAFGACDRIRKIIIPKSVIKLNGNPFTATILTGQHYEVESESPYFIIENEGIYSSDKKTLYSCLTNNKTYDVLEGTKCIAKYAFSHSSKLLAINLPSTLEIIEDYAFESCDFTTLQIPDSVKHIGDYAFSDCKKLSKIVLPESLEHLGPRSFYGCKYLQDIILPKLLKRIEKETFCWCDNLTQMTILNPYIQIDNDAFSGLDSLKRVIFYGCPEGANDEIFANNIQLKEIAVPMGMKKKFECIFPSKINIITLINTREMKNIVIDDSRESSTEVNNIDRMNVYKDEYGVLYSEDKKRLLTCEYKECVEDPFEDELGNNHILYNNRILNNNNIENVLDQIENRFYYAVLNGTESICDKAFFRCENLSEIIIPESVTSIGIRAFEACKTLKEIVIPSSVRRIKDYCFIGCQKLDTVILPEELICIGDSAFVGCENLENIKIPNSVTSIGKSSFAYCGLKEISIPNNIKEIGQSAFSDCCRLSSITISNGLVLIGEWAFRGCNNIKTIYCLTETVPEIPLNALYDTSAPNIDVIVPKGTSGLYKNNSVWGKLKVKEMS